ncbi:DUF6308 family protein [Kineococcus arenarius]|uniref:DUF6308 family protein n=1 Tax=unclassified Kineococcus TaxID=2621656 RepID=UPI003D7CF414
MPLLQEYYATGERLPTYTGRWFDVLAGGGDRPADRDRITADDVLAVQALSMRISPAMGRELVNGSTGQDLARLLQDVPSDVDLVDAGDDLIGAGSAANAFWERVREVPRAGRVTASKLLARKRPRLIPVYDSVVKAVLGWSDGAFWRPLRDELSEADRSLWSSLEHLREAAGLPTGLTPLRVFDVVLWMDGQRQASTAGEDDEILD